MYSGTFLEPLMGSFKGTWIAFFNDFFAAGSLFLSLQSLPFGQGPPVVLQACRT